MNIILYILVFLPMLLAAVIYACGLKSSKLGSRVLVLATAAEFALSCTLLARPDISAAAPGFCANGINLVSGSFHTLMAVITGALWFASSLIVPEYFEADSYRPSRYYSFCLFVLGASMGVFLSADLITMFVFFEMMSLSSYVWVAGSETPSALRASETYMYIGIIGGLAMLTGIILVYSCTGTFSLSELASKAGAMPSGIKLAAGLCILAGFGAKAGMFPLHIWLPGAYTAAPTPATALLSGVLSKSGVYGVMAISCWLFFADARWGDILLVLAVLTMFLGALLALFSTDMKRTLACSSMSQIGFILVGTAMCSLLGEHSSIAASGAVLHALNHSMIKLTLFTACAVVFINTGTTELNAMKGFGKGRPLLMFAFLMAACSVAGIPGFSGYISKTLLHESIVEYAAHSSDPVFYRVIEWIFLISGGLTFAYMSRLFYIFFIAKRPEGQKAKEKYMGVGISAVLAAGALYMPVMGLTAHKTMDRIAAFTAPFLNAHPMESVNYFSPGNLKGALISVCIGAAVFALVGMMLLTKRDGKGERYINAWPEKLDLENYGYRPLLRALALAGAVLARIVETVGAFIVFLPINLIFFRADNKWRAGLDEDFGTYSLQREHGIVQKTFSMDLLCACLGIAAFIIMILVKIL